MMQIEEWKRDKENTWNQLLQQKEAQLKKVMEELRQIQEVENKGFILLPNMMPDASDISAQDWTLQQFLEVKEKQFQIKREDISKAKQRLKDLNRQPGSPRHIRELSLRRHTIGSRSVFPVTYFHFSTSVDSNLPQGSTKQKLNELQATAEILKADMSIWTMQKQHLEEIIEAGEVAKLKLQTLEKQLSQKEKDLNDILKDLKGVKIIQAREKKKKEELENRISILKDSERRNKLLKSIQKRLIESCVGGDAIASFNGNL